MTTSSNGGGDSTGTAASRRGQAAAMIMMNDFYSEGGGGARPPSSTGTANGLLLGPMTVGPHLGGAGGNGIMPFQMISCTCPNEAGAPNSSVNNERRRLSWSLAASPSIVEAADEIAPADNEVVVVNDGSGSVVAVNNDGVVIQTTSFNGDIIIDDEIDDEDEEDEDDEEEVAATPLTVKKADLLACISEENLFDEEEDNNGLQLKRVDEVDEGEDDDDDEGPLEVASDPEEPSCVEERRQKHEPDSQLPISISEPDILRLFDPSSPSSPPVVVLNRQKTWHHFKSNETRMSSTVRVDLVEAAGDEAASFV